MITFNWTVSASIPDDKFDITDEEFSDRLNYVPAMLDAFVKRCNDSIEFNDLGISLRLHAANGEEAVVRRND